ncbi:uncharacterized protein Z520_12131 [Fonsecaea multimorphosa CBS 102226]|uniref:RapZ C-terminal domain-containing protein n=1 Tax=Fonsecaea multimorphosa CBS 102226 TaxID=1442371 RepID=A0A0D2K710_9EURO|nr:uncharacterized protein Z520_12131 [Fonsecaea multimorphosa CBS 102226]KIX92138.1 hypothetical protein Z520_12131 [Fonsecaea multimorphosa CBS 102226]
MNKCRGSFRKTFRGLIVKVSNTDSQPCWIPVKNLGSFLGYLPDHSRGLQDALAHALVTLRAANAIDNDKGTMEDLENGGPLPETEVSPATTQAVTTFELVIISYGHAHGPLTLPDPGAVEQLTFSVRSIKNPPAKLRRTHTGLSSHLRKEVMASSAAVARLGIIVGAVQTKMVEMKLAREGVDPTAESPSPPAAPSVLVVGIMCERGKHRSVTFAEELSRKIQADDCWAVSVQHRELDPPPHRTGAAIQDEDRLTGDVRAGNKPGKQRGLDRKKGKSSARRFLQEDAPDAEEDV